MKRLEDGWVGPHLVGIRDALVAALDDWQLPAVCEAQVLPGAEVAIDFVDEGCEGMAWVRCSGVFPSTSFPEPDSGASQIIGGIAYGIELGIMRWFPVPDEGDPLDSDAQQEAALQQMADMRAMFQVLCEYPDAHDTRIAIGQYVPAGPQGAAVGGLWNAVLQVQT